jgi:hypothetical protein
MSLLNNLKINSAIKKTREVKVIRTLAQMSEEEKKELFISINSKDYERAVRKAKASGI